MAEINNNTPIDELTIGGNIYTAGMFANNVDFALMFVQIMQFQLTKI